MTATPYLIRLAERLSQGFKGENAIRKEKHSRFILSKQMSDGGFRGREGDSDLYYTSFAVRSLWMLDGLKPKLLDQVSGYLRCHSLEDMNVVDLVSWLYTALAIQLAGGDDLFSSTRNIDPAKLFRNLEELRRDDGGYAKSREGSLGSTYRSFLVTLLYELFDREIPQKNSLIQFIYDRQRDDGGFVEIAPMRQSGTNPTAAATAILQILGHEDEEVRDDVREFLNSVRSDEGGFQANTRILFADGLSTFTGMLTALDWDLKECLRPKPMLAFLTDWLELPTGGFRGASWDDEADVEYTFYGLGCLALRSTVEA